MPREAARARVLFDRTYACANDLGLMAEQVETGTRAQLGNFPQAFSHLGHVLAAVRLNEAEHAAAESSRGAQASTH
jgi:alpha,alpha-trehalase